jgi:hypothetical protein
VSIEDHIADVYDAAAAYVRAREEQENDPARRYAKKLVNERYKKLRDLVMERS